MPANLCRVLILAMIGLTFFSLTVKAQKRKIPVDKPVSKSSQPIDKKLIDSKSAAVAKRNHYSALELHVVEEMNLARSHPQKFVGFLEEYRKATKGKLISLPGRIAIKTIEGVTVINEAIGELQSVSNLKTLEISDKLSDAARMNLKDLK